MFADSYTRTPANYVTIESLATGADVELSRFVCGTRALLFVRLVRGAFGIVSVSLDYDGAVSKIFNVMVVRPKQLAELDAALVHARREFESAAS